MALTREDAFKVGFLKRCADEGLDAAGIAERVDSVYAAVEKQADALGNVGTLAKTLMTLSAVPAGVMLVGGPTLGAVSGAASGAAANMLDDNEVNDPDGVHPLVDSYHKRKLKDLYDRHAEQARRRTRLLQRQQARRGTRSTYGSI